MKPFLLTTFLYLITFSSAQQDHCDLSPKKFNYSEIAQWSKDLFKTKDSTIMSRHWNSKMIPKTLKRLREFFYKMSAQPFTNYCNIIKNIGGDKWLGGCGFPDGEKFVCMDKLYKDIQENQCLVYSFGIGHEWSFETRMHGVVNMDILGHFSVQKSNENKNNRSLNFVRWC